MITVRLKPDTTEAPRDARYGDPGNVRRQPDRNQNPRGVIQKLSRHVPPGAIVWSSL